MKKLFIGLFLCVFLLSGFGLFRLNELNKIPINVENFSTYNLVVVFTYLELLCGARLPDISRDGY